MTNNIKIMLTEQDHDVSHGFLSLDSDNQNEDNDTTKFYGS